MRPQSIRARLTAWYTAVLTFALLTFSITTWVLLRHALTSDLRKSVTNEALGLATYLAIEEAEPAVRFSEETEEYSQSLQRKHLLALFDSAGSTVYANWPDAAGIRRMGVRQAPEHPFSIVVRGETYLAFAHTFHLGHGNFEAIVALPEQPNTGVLNSLAIVLAAIVPVFLAASVLGGYWLSRRALKPVADITERARAIGLGDLSERLPVLATQDELQELTLTWNAMLDRIEAAVKRIRQFTADASHELRTPLAIIRLGAENVLRRARSETQYRAALSGIQSESEKLTGLIEDLLLLAQTDAHAPQGNLELVEISPAIEKIRFEFAAEAGRKRLALSSNPRAEQLLVRANARGVERILRILLDNAIKYTPEGGRVDVQVSRWRENVRVEVIDSGIGIPPELRPRIFERFYRVESSRNKDLGGYGLGLAMALALAQQYRGTITVEGNDPNGSKFSLLLPEAV